DDLPRRLEERDAPRQQYHERQQRLREQLSACEAPGDDLPRRLEERDAPRQQYHERQQRLREQLSACEA
ncbi:hypothetical protein, partial [Cronobacter malonaticus]|uniref:hypothetical protein n=1 Tax=Cronobacter malonaticus TaxID=413503 RepID=UPI0018F8A94F